MPNLALAAATVSSLLQAGAQLFAVTVIVGTVTKAPPRSLAMYSGEYGYKSASFWEVMPTITLALLLIALLANWMTRRRRILVRATMRSSSDTGKYVWVWRKTPDGWQIAQAIWNGNAGAKP